MVVPVPSVVLARAVGMMLAMTTGPMRHCCDRCVIRICQRESTEKPKHHRKEQHPFHVCSDNLSFENLFYSRLRGIGSF
jgi:hypothetical protein